MNVKGVSVLTEEICELRRSSQVFPDEIWLRILQMLDCAPICRVSSVDRDMRELVLRSDSFLFRRLWNRPDWTINRGLGYRGTIMESENLRRAEIFSVDTVNNANCVQVFGDGDVLFGTNRGISISRRGQKSYSLLFATTSPVLFFGPEPLDADRLLVLTENDTLIVNKRLLTCETIDSHENDGVPLDAVAPASQNFVAVGFSSGTVRVTKSDKTKFRLKAMQPADRLAATSRYIAACSRISPRGVTVWCAETGQTVQRFDSTNVAFDLVRIGGIHMLKSGNLLIWDGRRVLYMAFLQNGFVRRLAETSSTGSHTGCSQIIVSPDENLVVASGKEASILLDLRTGILIRRLEAHCANLTFSTHGKYVIASQGKPRAASYTETSELPYLLIFSADTGELLRKIRITSTWRKFSACGSTIAGVDWSRGSGGHGSILRFALPNS